MEIAKKILVPTDFSETAHNALQATLLLSTKQKVEIFLVHFYHIPVPVDMMGQPMFIEDDAEEMSEMAEDKLDVLRKEISNKHPEIKVHTLAIQALMGDALPELCKDRGIDMIICGTKGADWLGEHLTGTNTTSILGGIAIPILVVPEKCSLSSIHKIVFATDFQFADITVLTALASLAKPFSAIIEVVHMSESSAKDQDTFDWMEEIGRQRVKYPTITYQNTVSIKPTYHILNEYLEKQGANLLVLTTTGKNFFQRTFSGSLTWEMACHSTTPLLIYHIQDNKLG